VAESWFLKIDGIEGESTDDAHTGEIDVLSWSWGVSQTGKSTGTGTGAASGKAQFQDFHFVARISRASPVLFMSCATGTHHKSATLSGTRAGAKLKSDFLKYKLTDVRVTSLQQGDVEGGPPAEQFSLSYGKFEVSFQPFKGPAVTAGFDLKANKKL
jgi:type VI secretion system secreted protein Hcp